FHLDLLFEHHHLSVEVGASSRRPHPALAPAGPPQGAPGSAAARGLLPGAQVGAALQQTWQHVLRWGDRLGRSWLSGASAETREPAAASRDAGAGAGGWWEQLGQASRIYAAPGNETVSCGWWARLRAATGDPGPGQDAGPPAAPVTEPRGTELQLLQTKAGPDLSGPRPSGSADTSATSSPEDLTLLASAGEDPTAGGKPAAVPLEPRHPVAPPEPELGGPGGLQRSSWLGRLFGAPSPDAVSARSRRPSCWLSPGTGVLAAVAKGLAAEKPSAQEGLRSPSAEPAAAPRAVRALCDHAGAAAGHLSFRRGDVLQLLSTVDEDWIRCGRGDSTGLVPVGYTSLIL
ncbi:RUSC1 protein, partial [Rhinopomastus cyanomelas]|nr:RUSC1 protein [Rhinopomastus cyanomelas]